jgi:anti-anti-sigma factor
MGFFSCTHFFLNHGTGRAALPYTHSAVFHREQREANPEPAEPNVTESPVLAVHPVRSKRLSRKTDPARKNDKSTPESGLPRSYFMQNLITYRASICPGHKAGAQCRLQKLVRGNEKQLVDRLMPLVRSRSLVLDLDAVERIDAAGVSALIDLYRGASEAGQRFTVENPRPRVAQVLALLGLEKVLMSQNADSMPHFGLRTVAHAA